MENSCYWLQFADKVKCRHIYQILLSLIADAESLLF